MPAPKRLFETKSERAARLPVGTWFVFPDTTPKRYKYYQPRLYRVQNDHKPSTAMDADLGIWDVTGVNSPEAAYERVLSTAQVLNSLNADEATAQAYVAQQRRANARRAAESLGRMLSPD